MKKTLFLLFSVIILVSGCSKDDENHSAPLDTYSWTVVNTNTTKVGSNTSIVEFYSDRDLSDENLSVTLNGETISNFAEYNGNTATITTQTNGVDSYHLTYTHSTGDITSILIPTYHNTK